MSRNERKLDLINVIVILVQTAFVCLWFYLVNRFELFSREGYQYSMYNGLYVLCGVGAVFCMVGNQMESYRLRRRERAVIALAGGLYSLATVMGNYPAFLPFDSGSRSVWGFVLALVGGYFVGSNVLTWCVQHLPRGRVVPDEERRSRGTLVFWLSFLAIGGIYLLYFFCAAYPGYFSRDSFSAIAQGLNGTYDNTSPFWHTMVVKFCLDMGMAMGGQGNSAVWVYGAVQAVFMAAVFAYAVTTLYQAGMPRWCAALVFGLYAFLSYHVIYSATMWKDIPFSGGALLVVLALYRILKGIGKRPWLNDLVFILGGIVFCLMRTNGWYSYLVMALAMAGLVWKQNRRLLTILCAVLAVTWICNHPLLDALDVEEGDFVEAFAVPFQQITRTVVEDGNISDEDMAMIERIFWIDQVKALHDPLTVDPMKFEAFRSDSREYLKENLGAYAGLWLRLGRDNPWIYTKAWIDETQGYWNAGYHFWITPLDGNNEGGTNEDLGITRPGLNNWVSRSFARLFALEQSTPPITQPLYGIGFQVWLLLLCFFVLALQRREEVLLTLPILVIVVGLWLGTPVFAEFRYAYPVFVTVPVLLCITAFAVKKP